MTTKALASWIDKSALLYLPHEKMTVQVEITDTRMSYGQMHCQVRGYGNSQGRAWVGATRLTMSHGSLSSPDPDLVYNGKENG